jgi:hypothetical protein
MHALVSSRANRREWENEMMRLPSYVDLWLAKDGVRGCEDDIAPAPGRESSFSSSHG